MSLVIEGISKEYNGKIAVKDVSLNVNEGSIFGMIGQNGAGKSTTFRMIMDILKPTRGFIRWKGIPIQDIDPIVIGYLPEERGLFPKANVYKQLVYLARLKGVNRNDAKSRVNQWLDRMGMSLYHNQKLEELSKGNQQKIQLISSVIHLPELLILDEPFSGLDPVNVNLFKSVIKELNTQGITIIFSSHHMEHVEELCNDICILKKGKIITYGNLNEILNKNDELKLVVKATNIKTSFFKDINGIVNIQNIGSDKYQLIINTKETMHTIFNSLSNNNFQVSEFYIKRPNLNEIFIQELGDKNEKNVLNNH